MTARRLRQALANTLDALDSRTSDVDGWYLWGVVLRDAPTMTLSLCIALDLPPLPRAVARNVMERLARQLRCCSPPVHGEDLVDVTVNLAPDRAGVQVTVAAILSSGVRVERSRVMQARPHNDRAEVRSVRRESKTPLRPLPTWL